MTTGDYSPTSRSLSTMKIVLVGYLAITTLSFAFASPLPAIDFDGYVNTTQNHSNIAPMKHVPGDFIEARQTDIPIVASVILIVADVTFGLIWIQSDNPVRGNDV